MDDIEISRSQLDIDTQEKLQGVIDLMFIRAAWEPKFSAAYALMCKELAEVINAIDNNINFMEMIASRCKTELEKNYILKNARDIKVEKIEECADPEEKKELHLILEDEEKRLGITSIIRFISELFKQNILTCNIIKQWTSELLLENDEENLERLCKLLTALGKDLESAGVDLKVCFQKMLDLANPNSKVSSQIRLMLLDVIGLRLNEWIPRRDDSNSKTMDQIQKEERINKIIIEMNNTLMYLPRNDDAVQADKLKAELPATDDLPFDNRAYQSSHFLLQTSRKYNFLRIFNKTASQKFEKLINKVKDLNMVKEKMIQGLVDLIFEKAVEEPNFSVAYALMCNEFCNMTDLNVNDEINFRKFLIDRCQNELVKNTESKNACSEKVIKIEKANEPEKKKKLRLLFEKEEKEMRAVNIIKFTCKLYRRYVIGQLTIEDCIRHLLLQNDEENLECLCKLLTLVGKVLESRGVDLEPYLQQLRAKGKVSVRICFMILDVIELRSNRWIINPSETEKLHIEINNFMMNKPKKDSGVNGVEINNSLINTPRKDDRNYTVQAGELKAKPPAMDDMQLGSRSKYQWRAPPLVATGHKYDYLVNMNDTDKQRSVSHYTSSSRSTDSRAESVESRDDEIIDENNINSNDKSKVPALKYVYSEDQWSPLNTAGKKVYEREFLMNLQYDPSSMVKPSNLPDLDIVLFNCPMIQNNLDNRKGASYEYGGGNHNFLLPTFAKPYPKMNPTPNKKGGHGSDKQQYPRDYKSSNYERNSRNSNYQSQNRFHSRPRDQAPERQEPPAAMPPKNIVQAPEPQLTDDKIEQLCKKYVEEYILEDGESQAEAIQAFRTTFPTSIHDTVTFNILYNLYNEKLTRKPARQIKTSEILAELLVQNCMRVESFKHGLKYIFEDYSNIILDTPKYYEYVARFLVHPVIHNTSILTDLKGMLQPRDRTHILLIVELMSEINKLKDVDFTKEVWRKSECKWNDFEDNQDTIEMNLKKHGLDFLL